MAKSTRFFVSTFIRHYLALGADEIFLYFDDPHSASYSRIAAQGKVRTTHCDDAYWSPEGGRPVEQAQRQLVNIRDALRRTQADWLLHADIDELIYARRPVRDVLDAVSDDTFCVSMRPLEAVWEDFPSRATTYRTPWFKDGRAPQAQAIAVKLYGEELAELSRGGIWGHIKGKSFISTQHEIGEIGVHVSKPRDKSLVANVETADLDLLHYEALLYSDWEVKAVSRMTRPSIPASMSPKRRQQMELIKNTVQMGGAKHARDLYAKMNVVTGQDLQTAIDAGFIVERRLDFRTPFYWNFIP